MTARRFLRPTDLVPVGNTVLAFDEFHPVAAVVEAASGEARRLISWRNVSPYPSRHIAGDGDGVWVQASPVGPLIRVGLGGVEFTSDVDDVGPLGVAERTGSGGAAGLARLRSAGPRTFRTVLAARKGAWVVPVNPPGPDDAAQQDADDCVLRFVAFDGRARSVRCPGRVVQIAACDGSAFLRVAIAAGGRPQPPVGGNSSALSTAAEPSVGVAGRAAEPRDGWLRLPDVGLGVDRITVAGHGVAGPPRTQGFRSVHYEKMAEWYRQGHIRRRDRAGGLDWIWGWEETGDEGIWGRRTRATGHDPVTRQRRRAVDLGPGWVENAVGDGRYLWLTIRRRVAPGLRYPTEVLRVDGATGDVHSVLGLDEIDIADEGWPLAAQPADADEHAQRELTRVVDTVQPGNAVPGSRDPAANEVSDRMVDVAGCWPDTTVRLRFHHTGRPGLLVQRDFPVFDELGRRVPVDLEWAGWRLDYWLDSGLAPPSRDAVDGVLEM